MNLGRSSIKVFAAKIAAILVGYAGLTYFARELGPHHMGVFFLFQALLSVLALFSDFGITEGLVKRLSENKYPEETLSAALMLKTGLIATIFFGIVIFRGRINRFLGLNLALWLGLALVLTETSQVALATLKGELRVGETAIPSLLRQVTYVGVSALFVVAGLGTHALIYGLLAGLVVLFCAAVYKSSVRPGRPSLARARSLVDFSKYGFISSVSWQLYNWLDVFVVGFFLTQSAVGAYEVAWRVSAITLVLSKAVAMSLFPQVSQWGENERMERIERAITRALTPSLLLVIPAFFGTVLFAREILGLLFGNEYTVAWSVLIVLMGNQVFQGIRIVVSQSLQALDRPDLTARAALPSLVTNVVLNVILVVEFGLVGAAVATAIATLLDSAFNIFYFSRLVSLTFPVYDIGWCILSAIGMTFALLGVKSVVQINTLPILLGAIAIGMGVYGTLVLALPSIRNRARRQLYGFVR